MVRWTRGWGGVGGKERVVQDGVWEGGRWDSDLSGFPSSL